MEDDDLAFLRRFVLASGSLKDLAQAYGVSYPTVRLRLDRLIQKINIVEEHSHEDHYQRLLRAQFADGKLDSETFRKLLEAYQTAKNDSKTEVKP